MLLLTNHKGKRMPGSAGAAVMRRPSSFGMTEDAAEPLQQGIGKVRTAWRRK